MMDRVEVADVYVVSANDYILTCRIDARVVAVRLRSLLPGTEIKTTGDRGLLVLTRETAVSLGLATRRAISQDNGDLDTERRGELAAAYPVGKPLP